MQRYVLVLLIGFTLCCAAYDHNTEPVLTEQADHQSAPQSEFSNFAASPASDYWWEDPEMPQVLITFPSDDMPIMLSLTDSDAVDFGILVEESVIDTTVSSVFIEWSLSQSGPWTITNAQITRNPWEDAHREDTTYVAYFATWRYWARDLITSGSCVPMYFRVAVYDHDFQRTVSEPMRFWLLVYEMPLYLWVDPRYCQSDEDVNGEFGTVITSPLILIAAALRQSVDDPRVIERIDLYKKPYESPDVYASWEKVETSVTTDSLTPEGGARLSRWRWFVHVDTWTSPVNLRLVVYYQDGSISWDCNGDGKFDDYTLLFEDGGQAIFPYQYRP